MNLAHPKIPSPLDLWLILDTQPITYIYNENILLIIPRQHYKSKKNSF